MTPTPASRSASTPGRATSNPCSAGDGRIWTHAAVSSQLSVSWVGPKLVKVLDTRSIDVRTGELLEVVYRLDTCTYGWRHGETRTAPRCRYLQLAHNEWDPARSLPAEDPLQLRPDRPARPRRDRAAGRVADPAARPGRRAGRPPRPGRTGWRSSASRPFGGTDVLDGLWRRLGIDTVMTRLLAGAAGATRVPSGCCSGWSPTGRWPRRSKLAAADWINHDVHIDGLPETTDDACYRAMDWLHRRRATTWSGRCSGRSRPCSTSRSTCCSSTPPPPTSNRTTPTNPWPATTTATPCPTTAPAPRRHEGGTTADGDAEDGGEQGRVPDLRQVEGLPRRPARRS